MVQGNVTENSIARLKYYNEIKKKKTAKKKLINNKIGIAVLPKCEAGALPFEPLECMP